MGQVFKARDTRLGRAVAITLFLWAPLVARPGRRIRIAGAALALALLSAAFPPQRRAWALGIFSSVTGIAVLAALHPMTRCVTPRDFRKPITASSRKTRSRRFIFP